MAKVFISYRRADSASISGRIYDRLVAKFKRKNVFKDVDDIPAGVDFGDYIHQSLRECVVMLVVIGRDWLDARTSDGSRRLDNPTDWVRVEIETALALGLTVIPLLVERAPMPQTASLPASLRKVVRINGLQVRNDPDFAHDMERVIAAIERAFAAQRLPGIFRRGATAQSTPRQKTSAKPAQSEHRTSHEPLFTMPSHPSAPSTFATPKMAPPKQPSATGRALGRNILLTIVVAGLIVASLGALLSHGIISVGTGGSAHHKTTPTATSTPAIQLPLTARLPGPGKCAEASGKPSMGADWTSYSASLDSYDCSNGQATRLYAGTCNSCGFDGRFDYNIPGTNQGTITTLPDTYTISVTVSSLTSGTDAHFFLMLNAGSPIYDFAVLNDPNITGTTYYKIAGIQCSGGQTCSGYFNTNKANTLAFRITGNTITALLNTTKVASQTVTTPLEINGVGFGVSVIPLKSGGGVGYTGHPYHVDFSNFSIAAA